MKRREQLVEFAYYLEIVAPRVYEALKDFAEDASGTELTEFLMQWQRATKFIKFPEYL
jgi:hypothetical protein